MRQQEAARLKDAISDHEISTGLREFFDAQAKFYIGKCKDEMVKVPPDKDMAIQFGAMSEAYRTAFNELKHFADNQLAKL